MKILFQRPAPEPWLETVDGDSPILLIAPHGGRAGRAARAMMHPKVNDLHTAEITRELAARLGASALINFAMDRNLIDCNRIPQLVERAPWMLEMIAERLAAIMDRHGRAIVLLIHGWNIIEPRIDLGLGARTHGRELRPAGSAHLSASDDFINGPLAMLSGRLRAGGIATTFGMRYPAGGVHNLVQAFTGRHLESHAPSLRRLSEIAAQGNVDTAQLELSVSVRLPGHPRTRCIEAITSTFSDAKESASADIGDTNPGFSIVRTPRPLARKTVTTPPHRVGVEWYDASARVGAMASFDLGTPGFGARIMMIVGDRRVVLCTCEGTTRRTGDSLSLGPLSLSIRGSNLALEFIGPAVVVPDGANYLSIERALATGSLDASTRLSLLVPIDGTGFDPAVLFAATLPEAAPANVAPLFGRAQGNATIEGKEYALNASARAGISFTGLGPANFRERRMIWALFDDHPTEAMELRRIDDDSGRTHENARSLKENEWSPATFDRIAIETSAPDSAPHQLEAAAVTKAGDRIHLLGRTAAFVPLSRPGPNGSRIYTSLGFGLFRADDRIASGMFEYSRRIDPMQSSDADNGESDSD